MDGFWLDGHSDRGRARIGKLKQVFFVIQNKKNRFPSYIKRGESIFQYGRPMMNIWSAVKEILCIFVCYKDMDG